MKRLLTLLTCLIPALAVAGPIFGIWARNNLTAAQTNLCQNIVSNRLNDTSCVDMSQLAMAYKTLTPSQTGRVLFADQDQIRWFTNDSTATIRDKLDQWKRNLASRSNDFVVMYSASGDWQAAMSNAGLTFVSSTNWVRP